jgi:Cu-Zn family superoxide dismutase
MKTSHLLIAAMIPLSLVACAEPQHQRVPAEAPPSAPPAPEQPAASASTEASASPPADTATAAPAPRTVNVPLQAKSGSKLTGSAVFTETADGVQVVISIANVKPGERASHVHEKGDCSAPDAASAGGHFNPHTHPHGLPAQEHRHLGDLGNITVGKDGTGSHTITVKGANLKTDDPSSFYGKAIIVHEKKDDGGQPTGNAGGRIACGEIKPAAPGSE